MLTMPYSDCLTNDDQTIATHGYDRSYMPEKGTCNEHKTTEKQERTPILKSTKTIRVSQQMGHLLIEPSTTSEHIKNVINNDVTTIYKKVGKYTLILHELKANTPRVKIIDGTRVQYDL